MNPNINNTIPTTPRSSVVAGILGIFLGSFGAHNWYLGENKKGILHVALFGGGFILCILGAMLTAVTANIPVLPIFFLLFTIVGYIAIFANGIWGLIEGIILLSQGDAGLAAKGYTIAAPVAYNQPAAPATPAAEAKTEEKPAAKSEEKTETKKSESKSSDKKSE